MLLARTVKMTGTTAVPGFTQKIQGGPKNGPFLKVYNSFI